MGVHVCVSGVCVVGVCDRCSLFAGHTILTCNAFLSASLYTATVLTPILCAVRITLQAISPRLATSSLSNNWTSLDASLKNCNLQNY